jgi:tripartite-type tricarboxylate transporter receptor subunit TctC
MDLAIQTYGVFQPYLGEGVELSKRIRLLGLSAPKRLSPEPNIPTFLELGYDVTSGTFHGLTVRPGTPNDIVETLVKAYRDAYQDPEYVDALSKVGRIGMFYQPPEKMPEIVDFFWKMGEENKKAGRI